MIIDQAKSKYHINTKNKLYPNLFTIKIVLLPMRVIPKISPQTKGTERSNSIRPKPMNMKTDTWKTIRTCTVPHRHAPNPLIKIIEVTTTRM